MNAVETTFKFSCPECGQRLEAMREQTGELIDCPTCARSIGVPRPISPTPRPRLTTHAPAPHPTRVVRFGGPARHRRIVFLCPACQGRNVSTSAFIGAEMSCACGARLTVPLHGVEDVTPTDPAAPTVASPRPQTEPAAAEPGLSTVTLQGIDAALREHNQMMAELLVMARHMYRVWVWGAVIGVIAWILTVLL